MEWQVRSREIKEKEAMPAKAFRSDTLPGDHTQDTLTDLLNQPKAIAACFPGVIA
jgi:hypothetical protein